MIARSDAARQRGTRRGRRGEGGFTLLELIAVMGIMALLMGIGLGFLQRGSSDMDLALAVMRDQLRVAANTAKANGLPTQVDITPGDPGDPVLVRARGLRTVSAWHFEPGERWFPEWLRPQLGGAPEPRGRFGGAWRPDPEGSTAMLTVAAGGRELFDLAEGFALRLELHLDERAAADVARLGRAFELKLDDAASLTGTVTLTDPGPRPGPVVSVQSGQPLRVGAWTTVELVHDGRTVILLVDGKEVDRTSARGACFQQPGDAFEISLANAPIHGAVDEILLLAHESGEPAELPREVELRDLAGPVRFSARGDLLAPARFTLQLGDEIARRVVGAGGVLEPWTQEAVPQ